MGKMLIVAEKPSVARDIAQALGGFKQVEGWQESPVAVISSGVGHLVEIYSPEADEGGKDLASLPVIPSRFSLRPIERTKTQFKLLVKLMGRADIDCVVNACDAGREGELIFRLIYELAGCRKPIQRMWLQSMTPAAIREAYEKPRRGVEFDPLSDAAKCRNESDWLIGINGTRAVTRLWERQTQVYQLTPVGRVQTPTLGIVVERENKIKTFVPRDYWEVHGTFGVQAGTYLGKWLNPAPQEAGGEEAEEGSRFRVFDKARAEAILAKCRGVNPSSVKDESKTTTSAAPKLFDLTTLQREANKRFKFSAKKTLDIAQALYEKHKATSYPRTDSSALPEDYLDKAKEVLGTFGGTVYGQHAQRVLQNGWVKPDKRIFDNTKITDHFAIIPTGQLPSGLDGDESKIYDMVVRRFVAAFHPAAEYNQTTRTTIVADETFIASGRVLVKQGWLEVYGQQQGDDKTPALCALVPGEPARAVGMEAKGLQTKPPARFTEATLLAAMEGAGKLVDDDELRDALKARGLGTPATRAAIIEGLLLDKDKNGRPKEPYMVREGKEQHLVPTSKGMDLIRFLDTNQLGALTSPRMTGEWEQRLRQIENGELTRAKFMGDIEAMTRNLIDVIRARAGALPAPQVVTLEATCPRCNGAVSMGPFAYGCGGCDFKVQRVIASRPITVAEATRLLREKQLPTMDGFVSSAKKKFSAGLRINDEGEVKFAFEERDAADAAPAEAISAKCPHPKCGGIIHDKGKLYACEKGDFKVWKEIAGRPLKRSEAERLIRDGSHPPLDGFKGSKGRFSAGLRLSRDLSKVEFVFDK